MIKKIKKGLGAIKEVKNFLDHKRFKKGIYEAKNIGYQTSAAVSGAFVGLSSLRGSLNQAWGGIRSNFYSLRRIFSLYNRLVKGYNFLIKKVHEQEKEINNLKKKLKN